MSEFVKYMHLERLGTTEVEGIEVGLTYVFPKLDGTNGSVWMVDDNLMAGSRNRVLSAGSDNAGFYAWVQQQANYKAYLTEFPNHTLYGEWLVPHTLNTYRDDAWRKFYIFDVLDQNTGMLLHYDQYKEGLDKHGLEYLAPLAQIRNGSLEHYLTCLEKNVFLIKDGAGVGEGVVIKNYGWQNSFGRVTWAKLITNSFKEKHHQVMGAPEVGDKIVEDTIVDEFVTEHLVRKVHAKITNEREGWKSQYIPQLLGMVWHDLITEEIWEILKKHKNPKIDFGALNRLTVQKVKTTMTELF